MEKTVVIGNETYRMRASALIPRLYRAKFGRDLITDMRQLQSKYAKIAALPADATEEERRDSELSVEAVAEGILAMYRDPQLRSRLGSAAEQKIRMFDAKNVHERMREIYLSV